MYAPVGLIPLFTGHDAVNKSEGLPTAPIWRPARCCELELSDWESSALTWVLVVPLRQSTWFKMPWVGYQELKLM